MKKFLIVFAIAVMVLVTTFVIFRDRDSFRPPVLTREQFLEDFDYMMEALEANFPYFGLIYRRNGVDMLALAEEVRETIANEVYGINYTLFFNLINRRLFYYAFPVGHLWLVCYSEYQASAEFFDWHLFEFDTQVIRYFGDALQWHGGEVSRYTLITNSIDEGHIAYIRVPPLGDILHRSRTMIDSFYSRLDGYEHLIIDIRGNPGGWPTYFDRYIAAPLIDLDDFSNSAQFHHFFMGGQYNRNYFSRTRTWRWQNAVIDEFFDFSIDDISNILPDVELSAYVMEDLALMDYFFVETTTVFNLGRRRAPFNGKVWMLVDERMFSGAMQVAAFYKDIGFATFVGESGGGMPSSRVAGSNYFSLPNTNFIVRYDPNYFLDNTGRPLEYGFVPHYPNREGMDALETVLAMIGEGAPSP